MVNKYYAVIHCSSLQHHGIKGQKWGVRRFQNEDGSYTAAGSARRNDTIKKTKREIKNNANKKAIISSTKTKLKDFASKRIFQLRSAKGIANSNMSNAELDAYLKRLKMANEYKSILAKEKENAPITKGKKAVMGILKGFGKSLGILKDAAVKGFANGLSKKIENALSATPEKKDRTNSTKVYEDLLSGKRNASDLSDAEFAALKKRYGDNAAKDQRTLEERIASERPYYEWLKKNK